jgi:hypothetical protein
MRSSRKVPSSVAVFGKGHKITDNVSIQGKTPPTTSIRATRKIRTTGERNLQGARQKKPRDKTAKEFVVTATQRVSGMGVITESHQTAKEAARRSMVKEHGEEFANKCNYSAQLIPKPEGISDRIKDGFGVEVTQQVMTATIFAPSYEEAREALKRAVAKEHGEGFANKCNYSAQLVLPEEM